MKSTRKLVAAGLAVATMFGTLGLAGCGGDDGPQESNPKTIKIWHYEEDNGAQGKALNRTPIIGLKKFGFDDWRCGSFVCVRIGGSTMTTGSGARR